MKLDTVKKFEGKAMNAVKHGLTSNKMFVLENETPEKWARMLDTWIRKLQPRDDAETQIVTEAAFARWRLQRIWTIETALFDLEMDAQAPDLADRFEAMDEGIRQASAFKALADNSVTLELLHRYETRHRRSFEKALNSLETLRKLDPKPDQSEPQSENLKTQSGPQRVEKRTQPPLHVRDYEFLPNEIPVRPAVVNKTVLDSVTQKK